MFDVSIRSIFLIVLVWIFLNCFNKNKAQWGFSVRFPYWSYNDKFLSLLYAKIWGVRSVSVYLFRRGTKQFIFIISIFTKFQINFIKCVHVGRGNETSNSPPLGLGGCSVTRDLWYLRGNDTNNKSLQFCVLNYSEAFTHLAHLVGWNWGWFKSWMWGRVGENALHIFWKWKKRDTFEENKTQIIYFWM